VSDHLLITHWEVADPVALVFVDDISLCIIVIKLFVINLVGGHLVEVVLAGPEPVGAPVVVIRQILTNEEILGSGWLQGTCEGK
jgi:hypothetical protein